MKRGQYLSVIGERQLHAHRHHHHDDPIRRVHAQREREREREMILYIHTRGRSVPAGHGRDWGLADGPDKCEAEGYVVHRQ
jgi:hypothetical protein